MTIFKNLSKFFMLVGIVSLVYGGRVFVTGKIDFDNFSFFRGETIISIAIGFYSMYLASNTSILKAKMFRIDVAILIVAFCLAIAIATVIADYRYGISLDNFSMIMITKLLLNILVFSLIYMFVLDDPQYFKSICLALCIPPLIVIPALFFPHILANVASALQDNYDLPMLKTNRGMPLGFTSWDRFSGLTLNPIHMSYMNIISLAYLVVMYFNYYYDKKRKMSVLLFLLCFGLCGLNLWAGSRSIIIAMIMIVFMANVIIGRCYRKDIYKLVSYNVLALLLLVIMLFALPKSNYSDTSAKDALVERLQYSQLKVSRLPIWNYYIGLIPGNILGLGINYEKEFYLLDSQQGRINTHSFILENWAYGGLFGLFAMLSLVLLAFNGIVSKIKNASKDYYGYYVGTMLAFTGIVIAALFTGGTFFIQFWILLALCLVPMNKIGKENTDILGLKHEK